MSAQIDYTTVAVIACASGFFGALGTEFAKYLLSKLKNNIKRSDDGEH